MGTKGLYVFLYKGVYYVFYNHMDSYPEGLGQILVIMLKTQNYMSWGDTLIDQIDNGNYIPRRFENQIETEPTEENLEDLKETEEWELTKFTNKYMITLLKWNYKFMLKDCKILKPLIEAVCPCLDRSVFVNKTKNFKDISEMSYHEWIYLIDLDEDLFSVFGGKNDVIFNIKTIPYNWIEKINE